MKNKMDSMLMKQTMAKPLPKMANENAVQWIVISLLASALALLIIGILARIGYNYRRSNNVVVTQNVDGIDVVSL